MAWKNALRRLLPEIAGFGGVGIAAAGVHLCVVWLLVGSAGVSPLVANPVAFLLAFSVSYLGHRRLTWATHQPVSKTIARWFLVSLTGFALNQIMYALALDLFPQIHYLILLGVVAVMVAIVSFALGKWWAFAHAASAA